MDEPRFLAAGDGNIHLGLPADERTLLRELARSTRELVAADDGDPALRRLHPRAHDDPELEREYRDLTKGQLEAGRERALEILEHTVEGEQLSADEADAWLRALNAARLVLGTRLDVDEDFDWEAVRPDDPRVPELALYAYASGIQEELVQATA